MAFIYTTPTPPVDLSPYMKIADLPPGAQFVSASPILCADLMINFPAGSVYKGKCALVSDLYGASIYGVMRCGYNGRIYYWEPITQPEFMSQLNAANMTVYAIASAPVIEVMGIVPTLTTYTANIDLANAWPGMTKEFRGSFASLLGAFNITGSGIGSTIGLGSGVDRRFVCYDTGSALAMRQLT